MVIFFSHSFTTYNTEVETKCLEIIKRKYPNCDIINPRLIEIKEPTTTPKEFERVMKLYILPIVRSCDLLVWYKDDSYSPSVDMELAEATRVNMPIEELNEIGATY